MIKKVLFSALLVSAVSAGFAQETDYTDLVNFDFQQVPTLPQFSSYKTFDITVLTTKAEIDKPGTGFSLPFQVKIPNLTQVDSTGDFHIVSLLQRYGGKLLSTSTASVNIVLSSSVYDKYGNLVKVGSLSNEQFPINFGRELTKEERENQDLLRRLIMEKALEANLKFLDNGLNGAKLRPGVRLASLDDVKKKPELQEFESQVKTLKAALQVNGLEGFKNAAAPFIGYWEKMSAFAGEGDADEVKRAALHDLALYYIAAGNTDKAREYIELYKPIDKQKKALMGLLKYKNSEELEKLIETLYPATAGDAPAAAATGKLVSRAEVIDAFKYITVNGTVKITGKKNEGTYTGTIKVNKIPESSFGNIVSLDPENIVVTVYTKDEAGQPKSFQTTVSKIDEMKDDNGTAYIGQKIGVPFLGDGVHYAFMKSSFTSAKVTVYRTILPEGSSEYVVKKAGDDKGLKSGLLNNRKKLEEYFNDCPSLTEKFNNGGIEKTASVEKIAAAYSACN